MPRSLARLVRIVLLAFASVAVLGAARSAEVDIVLAEEGPAYAQAADAVRREIGTRATVHVLTLKAWEQARGRRPDVVVALGNRALSGTLAAGSAPVVATLLPRAAFERIHKAAGKSGEGRAISAVFLDQPWSRQINLVRLMLPGKNRLGVLATPEAEDVVAPLRQAAREYKLVLREETINGNPGEIHPALARLLPDSDALIAVPDGAIYNAATLHNILVTTYRAQQPVFGFSAAYVRAGALAAVYSTPQQVGRQAGEVVARVLGGQSMPPPQFPRAFAVSVNATVARSLELAVEDESVLTQRLMRMEARE